MTKKTTILACCLFFAALALASLPQGATAEEPPVSAADLISGKPHKLPIPGMVTMVDLGAHSCIPCKMMTPIIEAVSKEYEGRAAIAFIDVWEHREAVDGYGISAIPTQIFYDAQGQERFRHVGFMDRESIAAKLAELGVE